MDYQKLCVHTVTTKPWNIHQAIRKYSAAGVGGISIWRDAIAEEDPGMVRQEAADHGVSVVSLVRGGFFTGHAKSDRNEAIDSNKRIIDEAAAVGAPLVVLVCGATPGVTIHDNLRQIEDGIGAVVDHAAAAGVKLAIEPLHPMYADTRSAVTTMKSANDICESLSSPYVGVAVDVFHVWWDPELDSELERCGRAKNVFAYHICDWKTEMTDMLTDRGLMGEGVIDLKRMRQRVENAGFNGFHEVEIFSTRYWAEDQDEFLGNILSAYDRHCR